MNQSRRKVLGRTQGGGFFKLPHAVLESPNYRALSAHARMLLNDIGLQFRGANNGDLSAAWKIMQPRGWRSRDTLCRALAELLHFGLIEKTRQGSLNHCNLFALTWVAIDECRNKLDASSTAVGSGLWKVPKAPMPARKRKNTAPNTTGVTDRHGSRASVTRPACQ